jgi:cell division initiation protein
MKKEKRLKPQEIRSREFGKKLFGYDPDEVETFLIEVANAYQDLLKEVEALRRETPEYKTEELVEKARKRIEEILQKKMEEKEELEKYKKEMEMEIEKLKLAQKKMFDRLRLAIFDMTRIIEEIKPDASGKEKGESTGTGSEGATQSFSQPDREDRRGEIEGKSDSTT